MYYKTVLFLYMALCLCFNSYAIGQTFDLSPPASIDLDPPSGQTRVIALTLTNDPGNEIDAFGLKVTYPTDLLTFQQCNSSGTLTDSWFVLDCNENTPGVITIGGFNTTAFTSSGVLINVEFLDNGNPGAGQIQLSDKSDDIANASTNSQYGIINSSVPVELVSFSAEVLNNSVKLNWSTASETNNFGFDIEKSVAEITFTKIGFLSGKGTTSIPQKYAFHDHDIHTIPATLYYRLKQIDHDGSFKYSNTIIVELLPPRKFVLQQNYPNPFNPETIIRYQLPEATHVSLVIYNLKGQAIRNLVNEEVAAGFHKSVWNGRDNIGREVASGVYVYRIKAGDFSDIKKLTLLR